MHNTDKNIHQGSIVFPVENVHLNLAMQIQSLEIDFRTKCEYGRQKHLPYCWLIHVFRKTSSHQVNLKSITPTSPTRVSLKVHMRNFILTVIEMPVQIRKHVWELRQRVGGAVVLGL